MMKKYLPLALAVVLVLGPILFAPSCANTTQAPTGGDKDTIPPYMVYINPAPGVVQVPLTGARFYFEFNEYVKIKTARNIFLSPPQEKPLKAKVRGKGILVTFEEPLDSNTTYTISFVDAIADNNEGNMFAGFDYVFSTGSSIDSMMMTGTVLDCGNLKPVKGATVMLYTDLADSAVFLHRPAAAAKTDDWGFFCLPYIKDTSYRLYAIKDDLGNNIYDPESDHIAFVDSILRPTLVASDTVPEILKYDMLDTLNCLARRSEHQMLMFREKPTKQYLKNHVRTGEYSAYITFQAPYAWIDSLWVGGYAADRVITEFNITQDSLLIWVNDIKRHGPDTLHLFVNYRKTDSTGVLKPEFEHLKMVEEGGRKEYSRPPRNKRAHTDSITVLKLEAKPETVEQDGFSLTFDLPLVNARFDSLKFRYVNPRQKEFTGKIDIEQDSTNLRHYIIRPKEKLQSGFDYFLKVPQNTFRDIKGFWNDSTEVKVTLPKDENTSTMRVDLKNVTGKIIVDLLPEKKNEVLRSYIVDKSCVLSFPYLKEGKYCIRVTDDGNRNSIVDTGSLLEHRQPEKVTYFKLKDSEFIDVPASAELEQTIDISELLGK